MALSRGDVSEVSLVRHQCRWTAADASLKVGVGLMYQAAVRTGSVPSRTSRVASSVTSEKRPSKTGVARAARLTRLLKFDPVR
jgi:hypothetical protein